MNQNDNRLEAHQLIDHIFIDLLPQHGMVQRPAQIQLSHEMLDAMLREKIALCDAGTGIGKTFSYLVAAVAAVLRTETVRRPILISTSSIALQNAVQTEYLPLLSHVLQEDGVIDHPLQALIRKGNGTMSVTGDCIAGSGRWIDQRKIPRQPQRFALCANIWTWITVSTSAGMIGSVSAFRRCVTVHIRTAGIGDFWNIVMTVRHFSKSAITTS